MTTAPVVLDEAAKAIIEQLQQDGRRPYTRIAEAVGLSEAAVRQRVQQMVEAGVMQIVAVTDPLTLGFRRMAMVGLKVDGDLRGVAHELASVPAIDYVVVTAGSFDLLCEVVCEDDDALLALVNDKIRSVPGVRETETFIYLQLAKQTYTWGDPMTDLVPDVAALQERARRHLWMHFTRLSSYADHEVPVIVRGEGPYVWDQHGRRYLDGLSGLFVVQVGHGRRELAEAAARQAEQLAYFPLWSYAHPMAVDLAARVAERAPGDINRVFFTTGGSEAVESAWKLARQYFRAIGQPQRTKVVSRNIAYHGTSMGALSITGIPDLRTPFEPLVPGALHAANTDRYRCRFCAAAPACTLACADDIEDVIEREGPDTVAAVFVEPVQNAGGCFTPPDGYFQRLREICDRHGILLVSDEVICAFGRLGYDFGCQRYGYQPDIITCAKGLTSGYSPLGAMLCRDYLAEPFLSGTASFAHGFTFAGHPVSCAVAMANLDIFDKEDLLAHVREHEGELRSGLSR
jgi:adenosylmethionine-8-amino-7-oxononanoate aminotransferase/DNA-binding Lrp family transcriptional regulator